MCAKLWLLVLKLLQFEVRPTISTSSSEFRLAFSRSCLQQHPRTKRLSLKLKVWAASQQFFHSHFHFLVPYLLSVDRGASKDETEEVEVAPGEDVVLDPVTAEGEEEEPKVADSVVEPQDVA